MKRRIALRISLFTLLGLLLFQNCSDPKINLKPSEEDFASTNLPKAEYCAPVGETFSAPVILTFIVDMSFSNIGKVIPEGSGGSTLWTNDKSFAKDINGLRFDGIQNFVNTCPTASSFKYNLVGFSTDTNYRSCYSEHLNSAAFLTELERFRDIQQTTLDESDDPIPSASYPYALGNYTSYEKAFSCAKEAIELEDNYSRDPQAHLIYFLTDGGFSERDINVYTNEANKAKYLQMLKTNLADTENNLVASGGSFVFNPLFYSDDEADFEGAKDMLNSLSAELANPREAKNINDLDLLSQQICDSVQPDQITHYSLSELIVVNLTTIPSRGKLLADSDMDGVSDEEEASLGLDPNNPRTHKALDILCKDDPKYCIEKLSSSTCSFNNSDFNISSCDKLIINDLLGVANAGGDSDGDFIPDYIELIRGTSIHKSDFGNNPTGDGISNIEKIKNGLDVNVDSRDFPVFNQNLVQVSLRKKLNGCDTKVDRYSYEIHNAPLVDVAAYNSVEPNGHDLTHGANENVYYAFSFWTSSGGGYAPVKMYAQKIKIHSNGTSSLGEFEFVGDM